LASPDSVQELFDFTVPLDAALEAGIDRELAHKTMPLGALGQLVPLAKQLALLEVGFQSAVSATKPDAAIIVFAADHGLALEPISAYPRSVTWQMVENFLAGGAAINVFARSHAIELLVVDAGVDHDFGERAGLINRKIASGTANCLHTAAMSPAQVHQALHQGANCVDLLLEREPVKWIGFGEMGIGNTSIASLMLAALLHRPIDTLVGRGTGVNDEQLAVKQAILKAVMARHAASFESQASFPPRECALHIASLIGGFEIVMMSGAMLRAAQKRKAVVVDGFISTCAAVLACELNPQARVAMVFGHRSAEQGHRLALEHLIATPLLDLGLRLGEGTGAALAIPLLRSAQAMLRDMASFESAAVSGALPS
jgi:nicotinate-nucleotide--dimethylbenzimidazole phosphoribosyltransferase